MTARTVLGRTLATAMALAACAKASSPADPVWGKEPCAHCAMVVGDKRHAAQVMDDGDRHYFDDIGCMVLWGDEHSDRPHASWVRDAGGAAWIDARSARYGAGARTPMDFGFETRAEGGVGWNEMREQVIAKQKEDR